MTNAMSFDNRDTISLSQFENQYLPPLCNRSQCKSLEENGVSTLRGRAPLAGSSLPRWWCHFCSAFVYAKQSRLRTRSHQGAKPSAVFMESHHGGVELTNDIRIAYFLATTAQGVSLSQPLGQAKG